MEFLQKIKNKRRDSKTPNKNYIFELNNYSQSKKYQKVDAIASTF